LGISVRFAGGYYRHYGVMGDGNIRIKGLLGHPIINFETFETIEPCFSHIMD